MNMSYINFISRNSAELDRNIRFEIPSLFSIIEEIFNFISNLFFLTILIIMLSFANWKNSFIFFHNYMHYVFIYFIICTKI